MYKIFKYVDDICFIFDGFFNFFYIVFDIIELYVKFFGLKINSIKIKFIWFDEKKFC